jgi:hypothetical protein
MPRPTLALLPAVPLLLVACACACDGAAKHEAATLAAAVDHFRRADPSFKTAQAQAVDAVVCSDARVCAAKDACVAAVDPTARALALKDEVASRLQDIEKGTLAADAPEARALPDKLDEAERLLKEGRVQMEVCDARLADLRVALGV